MNKYAIEHFCDIPYAYGVEGELLKVKIRCAKDDIKEVTLFYKDRYDWSNPYNTIAMKVENETDLFTYFSAKINLYRSRFRYYFRLKDHNNKTLIYDDRGFREDIEEGYEYRAFQYAYLAKNDIYNKKKILEDAIVYQIFPERFKNGDVSNDPEDTKEWGGIPTSRNSFGGDLMGITEGLDYLHDIGINMIYLTPVFLSTSNHKYNTKDYYKIDPQFGSIEDAKNMVLKAHSLGIKVIFDAVFNHSGHDFFAFNDIYEKGEKSEYLSWYHLDELPVVPEVGNYYTFANNIGTMPKFITSNEDVKRYLYDVGRYWIREVGIDGWRLDVCDEVDHEFWQGFKKEIEKENKDAILVGEIMHEASIFLRGNELDSIMNYPFKHAMTEYFAKRLINDHEFLNYLALNRTIYMDQIVGQLWNLLDSHDTPRFLTEAKGEINRLLLAVAFQFTYIGVPYIYYGDEVGLDGGHDPYCRCCMIWDEDKRDKRILNFMKKIIHFRKRHNEFNTMDFEVLKVEDGLIVIRRRDENHDYILAFNNSDKKAKFKIDFNFDIEEITPCDMYSNEVLNILIDKNSEITLDEMSYRIFTKK